MQTPDSLEKRREEAQYHLVLAVESFEPPAGSPASCRVSGKVAEFRRHPGFVERVVGGEEFALEEGERLNAAIPCELGDASAQRPTRLEIWGSFIDGEFSVADFNVLP